MREFNKPWRPLLLQQSSGGEECCFLCVHVHDSLRALFPLTPLFIRLICCVAAVWTRRREGEAPFCTVRLQKPAAVCHHCDLKPQSVHPHTYTPMHLLYAQTNTSMHVHLHMIASRKTEWEREIKERKNLFHLISIIEIFTSLLYGEEDKKCHCHQWIKENGRSYMGRDQSEYC